MLQAKRKKDAKGGHIGSVPDCTKDRGDELDQEAAGASQAVGVEESC